MEKFVNSLARLKHELRVSKDNEIAALLGMSKTAFSDRKKRGSFFEREVVRLAAQRPELELDVTYVLTGQRTTEFTRQQLSQFLAVAHQMEPPGGPITEAVQTAFKSAGQVRGQPEYVALLEILDYCSPADLELLKMLAIRMVRGRVPEAQPKG